MECASLDEVRRNIDRIDGQIVALLAERGTFVKQAARLKKSREDVVDRERIESIVARVVALSRELGAWPEVTERVYREMIAAYIDAETAEHVALRGDGTGP